MVGRSVSSSLVSLSQSSFKPIHTNLSDHSAMKYAIIIRFCFLLAMIWPIGLLQSQQLPSQWLDGTVEAQLKSMYEKNEFQTKPFTGQWLDDSTGFWIERTDPETSNLFRDVYSVHTGELIESKTISESEKSHDWPALVSPSGTKKIEFDNQEGIFIVHLETKERVKIADKPEDRQINYYYLSWSHDEKYIAFMEYDYTDVRKRKVLIYNDPTYPELSEQYFARVGEKIPDLRVGIIEVDSASTTWLPIHTPEEGFYLGPLVWSKSSNELVVEWYSRFRDTRELFLASPTGSMKQIFRETDDAWVDIGQGLNSGIQWIADGQEFIVISEKDGWRHAYRFSRDGEELARLTQGDYDIIKRGIVDENGGWYYFHASPENATEQYLYRVPLDGTGTLERITPQDQPGTHDYQFSPDAKWAFHTFSTFDTPPIVELVEIPEHRVVKRLESNETLHEKAKTLVSRPSEFIQIRLDDNVVLDSWMIKPRDFDDSKQYPVFLYIYGEPYLRTVVNEWAVSSLVLMKRVIADLGYIVVSIDNRGTPAPKGVAWRRAVFGSLGPISTEDHANGLQELARSRKYMDMSRVGVFGWSGRGSNTLNAMFRKPEIFHVGIAVVPKPLHHLYNAGYQENFMRTPEVNPEGYFQSNPFNFAEGLKGKLLIVTGSGETNTHI